MELLVSPYTYILTTEGYIQAKVIQENPDIIIKSLLISQVDHQTFKVDRIDYGHIQIEPYVDELGQRIDSMKVQCPYVAHAIIYSKPLTEVCLLSALDGEFYNYDDITPGFHFVTLVKHMVVDLSLRKFGVMAIQNPLVISAYDLPSLTLSSDENGTATITYFNKHEA